MSKKQRPSRTRAKSIVHSDPEIMSGTPVFRGTRVPFSFLIEYLEAGYPLDEFLHQFPSVTRKTALAALKHAEKLVVAEAG